jgi:hypothetical protein
MIVLISGWKRSGKDTVGDYLQKSIGFKRTSFAAVLKDMVAEQYGIDRASIDDQSLKEEPLFHLPVVPKDAFSEHVTSFMKGEFKNVDGQLYWTRRALCILEGSIKRAVDSNYWVSRALKDIPINTNIVITDVRYRSEVEAVKDIARRKGVPVYTVRINRFETSPSQDPSEIDLDNYSFDFTIPNTGTVADLLRMATTFVNGYLGMANDQSAT